MRGGPLEIPPLVKRDAVAVGVGTGANGGVAGRGHGVGVVVVAIGEVGAAIEEEIEAVGGLEVIAEAVEVVAAELVEHEDHDQLGLGAVSIGTKGVGHRTKEKTGESGREES